jgi:putative membrane-bound dehydrogenase-like protein
MISQRRCWPLTLALLILAPVGNGQDPKADPDLPRVAARTPAESLKAFVGAPGFRVELVAAEPLVQSPVACDWDEDGRLYVVELPEYNAYAATRPQGKGRVVRLDDTDGDGVLDKRTVLAEEINYPTGIICWDGGIYVGAAPELLYLKDTDGDGKADLRKVILSGFGQDKAGEGQLNSFRWTLDNRILISTGLDGGELKTPEGKAVSLRSMNILLDPKTNQWQLTSGGGQHGMSLDDWGHVFVSGNSDPIHMLAYDARNLREGSLVQIPPAAVNILPSGKFTKLNRVSEVEPWRALRTKLRKEGKVPGSDEGGTPSGFFTGATGVTVYRGDAFPEEFRGNVFVGEVANNLVFRAKLKPNRALLLAERADAEREFLASKDVWFRPAQLANAPDGCLYVLDMYRELIEGAAFLAPQVLKNVDPSAGFDKGRIWRIVPENHKRRPSPQLSKAKTEELVNLLDHPNGWHRDTASRLLYRRQPHSDAIKKAIEQIATKGKTPQGRVHALYALAPLAGTGDKLLKTALADTDAHVREHALRLCEAAPNLARNDLKTYDVWDRRRDEDIRVRTQLALSLPRIKVASSQPGDRTYGEAMVFVDLAMRDSADPWMRLAILMGMSAEHMGVVLHQLARSQDFRPRPEGREFVLAIAELVAADQGGQHGSIILTTISDLAYGYRGGRPDPTMARAVLRVVRTRGSSATETFLDDPNNSTTMKGLSEHLIRDAVLTSKDGRKTADERVAAIKDLQIAPYRDVGPVLAETLKSSQPPTVQIATLEALGRFGDDAAPTLILNAWPAMTPAVRATATEVLLGRNNWVIAFLDAVESRKVARADIDPARVALLKKSPARNIGIRAAKLFAAPADRQKVFEEYRKALDMKGDIDKGKLVFKNQCSACHKLDNVGEEVGADLKAVKDRGLEGVLLSILDPNREVKPQYVAYTADLKNMRVVTGLLTAETATGLTIRKADGRSESILRADIESLRSLGVSYMPEGLEKLIDVAAMADLLAYLNSIK